MGLISLQDMVNNLENKTVYIPLYQRNYRWDQSMAEKLIGDILAKKKEGTDLNLGMITVREDNGEVEILDGQQRLITLSLIIKCLDEKLNEINKTKMNKGENSSYLDCWVKLYFERDPEFKSSSGQTPRHSYIYEWKEESPSVDVGSPPVDVGRMQKNYDGIKKKIDTHLSKGATDEKLKLIHSYIMKNTKILYNQTTAEPLDEFLNINFNKTPFCATDKIKAHMMLDTAVEQDSSKVTILKIMNLWRRLQYFLYQVNNDQASLEVNNGQESLENDMYQLIKQHYEHLGKNRMEILFEDRYYNEQKSEPDISGYLNDDDPLNHEFERLKRYSNIMQSLLEELIIVDQEGVSHPNYTAYSAYNLLCKKNENTTFFNLFGDDDKTVHDTLYSAFNLTNEAYNKIKDEGHDDSAVRVNQFMESMLISTKTLPSNPGNASNSNAIIETIANNKRIEDRGIFAAYQEVFEKQFHDFIEIIDEGKKASQQEGQGIDTLGGLLRDPRIKQIKIPQIQRDYVMGSSGQYLEKYLRKIRFEELCIRGENLKDALKNNIVEICQKINDNDKITLGKKDIFDIFKNVVINRDRKDLDENDFFSSNGKYIPEVYKKIVLNKIPGKKLKIEKLKEWLNQVNAGKTIDTVGIDYRINNPKLNEYFSLRNELCQRFVQMNEKLQEECHEVNYSETNKMHTSCIMGHLDEFGTFWVYDGQQRITTSLILLIKKLKDDKLITEKIKNFSFEGRDGANQILRAIINGSEQETLKFLIDDNTSYAIYKFWESLNSGTGDWKQYSKISPEFILDGMKFECIFMEEIKDAEQLFIEMNEGLQLEDSEKYKAELTHIIQTLYGNNKDDGKDFLIKMDNKWLDKCGEEKKAVQLLQYVITMSWFEKKGYNASRKMDSLQDLDREVLELAKQKMDSFCKQGNIDGYLDIIKRGIEYQMELWCYTLPRFNTPFYCSAKIKLENKDFVDLIKKICAFKVNKKEADYYSQCFRLISEARENNGALSVPVEDNGGGDKENQDVAIELVNNLIKNRQDRYHFQDIKKFEDNAIDCSEKYSDEWCDRDYHLEDAEEVRYNKNPYCIDYEVYSGDFLNKYKLDEYLSSCLWIGDKQPNRQITIIDDNSQESDSLPQQFKCPTISKIIYNIEINKIRDININNSKPNLRHILGIEKGYYKLTKTTNGYEIIDRRKIDDGNTIFPFLSKPKCLKNIKNDLNDKIYILKNCDESMKDKIKEEIVEEYIKDPLNKSNYARQTQLYFENLCKIGQDKEKCRDLCDKIRKKINNSCSKVCKYSENCERFALLKVITEDMASRIGVHKIWKKLSGIHNCIHNS